MSNYHLDYTLSSKELYSALAAAKIVPKRGLGQVIRTILLLIVMVIIGTNMSVSINYIKIGIVLEAICIALLVLIWVLPALAFKSAIKTIGNNLDMQVEVQPGVVTFDDGTTVKMGENGSIEDYPKDRMFMVSSLENKDQVYIIPYRTVDFEQFEDFRNTIMYDSANENNTAGGSEQSEQDQEDDESFRLSQQIEELINNSMASKASEQDESIVDEEAESVSDEQDESIVDEDAESVVDEQDESIVDEDAESVVDEQDESIVDEDAESIVDEQSDDTQNDQTDDESVEEQSANEDETVEAEQEDDDDQIKIDFSKVIMQDVDDAKEMLTENVQQNTQPWAQDVVEDITPDMLGSQPMDQPQNEPEQDEDIPELIGGWSNQAAMMQAEEESVEPQETAEDEAVDNTDENEAVEDETVENQAEENEATENESEEIVAEEDSDSDFEGIELSGFDVEISGDEDIAPKIYQAGDIFDDSLRNLIDAYLN